MGKSFAHLKASALPSVLKDSNAVVCQRVREEDGILHGTRSVTLGTHLPRAADDLHSNNKGIDNTFQPHGPFSRVAAPSFRDTTLLHFLWSKFCIRWKWLSLCTE